jgi:hypothetical protein
MLMLCFFCLPAGNSWLSGTIPDGLSRMRNITLINLSNNWINGTLPTWLPELTELRVLNLGSNAGGNTASSSSSGGGDSSEEPVGLLGTIPAGLGNLRQLRELNLEANSLTGMLPKDICNGGACVTACCVALGCVGLMWSGGPGPFPRSPAAASGSSKGQPEGSKAD